MRISASKSSIFFVSSRYNRIRKYSADVGGYRRDQAKARQRKDVAKFEKRGETKGEISRNTIW